MASRSPRCAAAMETPKDRGRVVRKKVRRSIRMRPLATSSWRPTRSCRKWRKNLRRRLFGARSSLFSCSRCFFAIGAGAGRCTILHGQGPQFDRAEPVRRQFRSLRARTRQPSGHHIPGHPTIVVKIAGGVGGVSALRSRWRIRHPRTARRSPSPSRRMSRPAHGAGSGRQIRCLEMGVDRQYGLAAQHAGVWYKAPAQTLDEAKQKEVVIGAVGRNSPNSPCRSRSTC